MSDGNCWDDIFGSGVPIVKATATVHTISCGGSDRDDDDNGSITDGAGTATGDSDIEMDPDIDEAYIDTLQFACVKTCSCCKHSSNELNPVTRGRYLFRIQFFHYLFARSHQAISSHKYTETYPSCRTMMQIYDVCGG